MFDFQLSNLYKPHLFFYLFPFLWPFPNVLNIILPTNQNECSCHEVFWSLSINFNLFCYHEPLLLHIVTYKYIKTKFYKLLSCFLYITKIIYVIQNMILKNVFLEKWSKVFHQGVIICITERQFRFKWWLYITLECIKIWNVLNMSKNLAVEYFDLLYQSL